MTIHTTSSASHQLWNLVSHVGFWCCTQISLFRTELRLHFLIRGYVLIEKRLRSKYKKYNWICIIKYCKFRSSLWKADTLAFWASTPIPKWIESMFTIKRSTRSNLYTLIGLNLNSFFSIVSFKDLLYVKYSAYILRIDWKIEFVKYLLRN